MCTQIDRVENGRKKWDGLTITNLRAKGRVRIGIEELKQTVQIV